MSRTFSREDLADQVLNPRLIREKAKSGDITASLIWNGESDLDLHAAMEFDDGTKEKIYYKNKDGTNGKLDVDANATQVVDEPVENIFWKKPHDGKYTISVHNFKLRDAPAGGKVPFRLKLALPDQTLDYEGKLGRKESAKCFAFKVKGGDIEMLPFAAARVMRRPSAAPRTPMRVMAKMKAMKAMKKPMKPMKKPMKKVMKKVMMKAMKVAKGRGSKAKVLKGAFEKTSGGLKASDLTVAKDGKRIVSKKRSALGKNAYKNIKSWTEACQKARAELGITGFAACKKGSAFYKKARELFDASKAASA